MRRRAGITAALVLVVLGPGSRPAAQQQVKNCGEEYLCGQGANGIELWVHVFEDRNNDGQYTEGEPCFPSQVAITPSRSAAASAEILTVPCNTCPTKRYSFVGCFPAFHPATGGLTTYTLTVTKIAVPGSSQTGYTAIESSGYTSAPVAFDLVNNVTDFWKPVSVPVRRKPSGPQISIDHNPLDFGAWYDHFFFPKTKSVKITNTGDRDLHVTGISVEKASVSHIDGFSILDVEIAGVFAASLEGDFGKGVVSIEDLPPVPPGQTLALVVAFYASGTQSDTLIIASDAPGSPHTVLLTGHECR